MEETQVELSTEEKKQAYKALVHFRASDKAKEIIEEGKEEASAFYDASVKELKTRKKPELLFSELNKTAEYAGFLSDLISKLDESEGGKIMNRELTAMRDRALNNVEIRVESGFDSPRYTKLDMLKSMRAEYECIDQTFDHVIGMYAEQKKEEETLHPYEEA